MGESMDNDVPNRGNVGFKGERMPRQATFAVALIVTGLASAAFGAGLSAGASASLPERIMEGAVGAARRPRCVARLAARCLEPEPAVDAARYLRERRFSWWPFAGRPISIPSISGQARRRRQVPRHFVIAIAHRSMTLSQDPMGGQDVGFHQVRPVVKLADGTWLVGDRATGPSADFNETDISIADVRWIKLDIARVVAVGNWIEHPDLSKVDEIGFADLMPGSGHGPGGYVNVGRIEVYEQADETVIATGRGAGLDRKSL